MLRMSDLREYQSRMVAHGIAETHWLLGAGLGLGKTVMGLVAAAILEACGDVKRILVVAPKNVALTQWDSEAAMWSPTAHLDFAICVGSAAVCEAAIAKDATVTVVNGERLLWLMAKYPVKTKADGTVICDWPWDMVIIDESYLFSNAGSKRFKRLRFLTRRIRILPKGRGEQELTGTPIKRCVLMTGTPAPNGLEKLWSQMCLIDDGERLGRTFSAFQAMFYFMRPGASRWEKPILRDGCGQVIKDRIKDKVVVLRQEDYLELPEILHRTIPVELPKKVRKLYDQFERDFVSVLENGEEIYSGSVAAQRNKMMQICNGAVIHGDPEDPDYGKEWTELHTVKLDVLEEELSTVEGNVIVVYWFQADLARLKKRFPKAVVFNEGDPVVNRNRWNKGEIPILLLNPASGGVGINLQHGGATIYWFGFIWDLYLWEQTIGRIFRSGQLLPVTINILAALKTVEQRVARSLQEKTDIQDDVCEYLAI